MQEDDALEPNALWKLFCQTGEPLAYMLYRSAEAWPDSPGT